MSAKLFIAHSSVLVALMEPFYFSNILAAFEKKWKDKFSATKTAL
jgi:hypothetical protein